ncbi:hypothetical protein [Aliagarivorans marinus]|uniref:hypothetical protein n=1 Tax=Aliagarivorans marinus TaxID=561965 RepID=UPI000421DFB5|nr:hypothetical protein [Aliagarivorans marinus]
MNVGSKMMIVVGQFLFTASSVAQQQDIACHLSWSDASENVVLAAPELHLGSGESYLDAATALMRERYSVASSWTEQHGALVDLECVLYGQRFSSRQAQVLLEDLAH